MENSSVAKSDESESSKSTGFTVVDDLRNKNKKQHRKTTKSNIFIEIAIGLGMILNRRVRLSLLVFWLTLIP